MMYIFAFVHLHIWHLHICTFTHLHICTLLSICTLTKGDLLHIYTLHICILAKVHI